MKLILAGIFSSFLLCLDAISPKFNVMYLVSLETLGFPLEFKGKLLYVGRVFGCSA